MKYCPRCGVQLSPTKEICPLCGSTAVDEKPVSAEAGGTQYPIQEAITPETTDKTAEGFEQLSYTDRRRIAVELVSVAAGFALVVSVLADFFVERTIGWARYSSVGIVMAWTLVALPLLLWKRPWILLTILLPALSALVFLLDAFSGSVTWFFTLGWPLLLLASACAAVSVFFIRSRKRRGLNVIGVVLAAVAAFCVGLELVLDLHLHNVISLQWSMIVALALVPTSGFLFYLHYRVVHKASLRKLFRL